jgi:hypothetical protein
MPSAEYLFSTLSYVLFVAPCAVVVIWVFLARHGLVPFLRCPGFSLGRQLASHLSGSNAARAVAGRLAATPAGTLCLDPCSDFPGLAVQRGEVPRLFARNTSHALHYIFVFFLLLPLVLVPLRYLADRIEGPQIWFWHWLLVFGPIPVLAIWLVTRIRRNQV